MPDQGNTSEPGVHHPGARRGEEIKQEEGKEPGRRDTGTDAGGRPTGESTGRDATRVDPQDPIDPKSPNFPPA